MDGKYNGNTNDNCKSTPTPECIFLRETDFVPGKVAKIILKNILEPRIILERIILPIPSVLTKNAYTDVVKCTLPSISNGVKFNCNASYCNIQNNIDISCRTIITNGNNSSRTEIPNANTTTSRCTKSKEETNLIRKDTNFVKPEMNVHELINRVKQYIFSNRTNDISNNQSSVTVTPTIDSENNFNKDSESNSCSSKRSSTELSSSFMTASDGEIDLFRKEVDDDENAAMSGHLIEFNSKEIDRNVCIPSTTNNEIEISENSESLKCDLLENSSDIDMPLMETSMNISMEETTINEEVHSYGEQEISNENPHDGNEIIMKNVENEIEHHVNLQDMMDSNNKDDENDSNINLEECRPILMNILQKLIEVNENPGSDPLINSNEKGETFESIHIFCNVCLKHLRDNCYNVSCKFSHSLPPNGIVEKNLDYAPVEEIFEAYNQLLINYDRLKHNYFSAFCKVYGKKKLRTQLTEMIGVYKDTANMYTDATFLKDIVNGFVISGMPYHTTVEFVIRKMKKIITESQYHLLSEVILDKRNMHVLDHVDRFKDIFFDDNHLFVSKIIEKMLKLSSSTQELMMYSLNVLKKCRITTFSSISVHILTEFLENCKFCGHFEARQIYQRMNQTQMDFQTKIICNND